MKSIITTIILLLLIGCSTGKETVNRTNIYSTNVGTGHPANINSNVNQIFSRYNFEVYRSYSEDSEIYYESSWKGRDRFDDEILLGYDDVRSRIIIRARPRGRDLPGSLALFSVNYTVENESRSGSLEWIPVQLSPEAREYFREMSLELKALLETGFRTY
jgi:hypothetical protein